MRFLVVAAVLSAIMAACGGRSNASPPPGLSEAVQRTSAYQAAILGDGKLTQAEYEGAVLATVACLRDRGVRISVGPRPIPRNSLEFAWETSNAEEDAAAAAYDFCYREYQDLVDIVRYRQNGPSQAEFDAARAALIECLRQAGVPLPASASADDLRAADFDYPDAFATCQAEVTTRFNLPPGFAG